MPRSGAAQSQNLLKSSEAIGDGNWLITNVAASQGQTDPAGGTGASLITVAVGNTQHTIGQTTSPAAVVSLVTASVYVKQGTTQFVQLGSNQGGNYVLASFDLTNGVVAAQSGLMLLATIAKVPGGWYRISATWNADGVNAKSDFEICPRPDSAVSSTAFNAAGTETVTVYGAQMVQANWPGPYAKTTGAAVGAGTPIRSIPLTPRTAAPSTQNLVVWSSDLTNAAWVAADQPVTKTGGQADPFGGATAIQMADSAHTGTFRIGQVVTRANTRKRSQSVYAKAGTKSWIALGSGLGDEAWFNLSTGTVGTVSGATSASIADAGNGWFRCTLTVANQGPNPNAYVFITTGDGINSYTGDGTGTVLLYGPQIVEANWAGPYTPTGVAAVDTGTIRSLAAARTAVT